MLVLHIGLPKTASTFLQYRIFGNQDRYTYIHHATSGPLEAALKRLVRVGDGQLDESEQQVADLLPTGPVLVSDENIAMTPREAWSGQGPTPARTADRLARLAKRVGEVRVILGVRRQDTWLASRYAESAKRFPEFCQEDFDRRLATLRPDRLTGALTWLAYDRVHQALADALGEVNLLVVPIEMLKQEPVQVLTWLEEFLEVPGWVEAYAAGEIDPRPRNRLSTGETQWRLKRPDQPGTLTLDPKISRAVLARYRRANRQFAQATALPLEQYGYVPRAWTIELPWGRRPR